MRMRERKDGGQDLSLSSSCLLTVLVEDENDNPPRLTNNPGSLTIPDNAGPGDFLYKLEVRDEDSGANSQLQYFLLGEAGRFSLDQNTGGGGCDRGRRPGGALHR